MHSAFDVAASGGCYRVRIENGAFAGMLRGQGDAVFLADTYFAAQLADAGHDPVVIAADEVAKSLQRISDVIVALRERRVTRSTQLIAVGGGVVQDIAGFVASIYMRGIAWRYVPTTLLGMTDSCIGGKSSINVGYYKNLVGTFHPPNEIIVDPNLTVTLDPGQRAAGLIEAAKIAFCRGAACFDAYHALAPEVGSPVDVLGDVIDLSLHAKRWFVETDEFDRDERLLLNFGHTFGHAIETASGFALSHGVAVGLGILAALAFRPSSAASVESLRAHLLGLLGSVSNLSATVGTLSVERLLNAFESDKKHGIDFYALILVTEEGRVERVRMPRDAASRERIGGAFATLIERFTGLARSDPSR